jgi:hypothetical protein
LVGHKSRTGYPESLRRIAYIDSEKKKRLVFLTNLFNVDAPARSHAAC